MKVHHTKYKPLYEEYILDTVTDENGNELPTREAKIKALFDRFNSEYGWRVAQVGKQKAIADWLSGLALNIEYYKDGIVELAVKSIIEGNKIKNREALANPLSLNQYINIKELQY